MVAIVGTVFDAVTVYERLAQLASAVALWASARAHQAHTLTPEQAMADLTLRLRHPVKYRLQQVTRLFR